MLARPNVRALRGHADGLLIAGDAVIGVRYVPAGAEEAVEEPADFVVEPPAGPAGWRLDRRVRLPRPPMQRMGIKLNYATAMFKRPPDPKVWVTISTPPPAPGRTARIAGFTPIEGDRWTMLVSGYADDRPTRDPDDYRRRCERDFPPSSARSPPPPSGTARSSRTTRPTAAAATSTGWTASRPG